jgi:hypothetical protein
MLRRVTLVWKLGTFRNETLTTFLTPTFDDIAPSFGAHACTEAMLAFARSLGGLKGPFHGVWNLGNCVAAQGP